jgi:hypothetical protein
MKPVAVFLLPMVLGILLADCTRERHYSPVEGGYVNQYFSFGKKRRFAYRITTCTFEFEGRGHYRKNGDTLVLAFQDYKTEPSGYRIKHEKPLDSFTVIQLLVWVGTQPGDFVWNYHASLGEHDNIMYDTCRNTVGISRLAVKSQDSVTLKLSHINFQPFELRLAPRRKYDIEIEWERSPVWHFRAERITRDTIVLNIMDCQNCPDRYYIERSENQNSFFRSQ